MLHDKNFLVIGARAGGYGASIAEAAVSAGAKVFGTTLHPEDPREAGFFEGIGAEMIDIPLRYHSDHRDRVFSDLNNIQEWLIEKGVHRLDAVIHTVAGGFPRQPSVMKAVGDILKGNQTFSDLATAVKRNVYYVNARSFDDTISGLKRITDLDTQFLALTYRGKLPYFIFDTKKHLENLALRRAKRGYRTLVAALPEAWTQSSQFFTGIEVAVVHNYLTELKFNSRLSDEMRPCYDQMEIGLKELAGWDSLLMVVKEFLDQNWREITQTKALGRLNEIVQGFYGNLRRIGTFSVLRKGVEIISEFVRDASGKLVIQEFLKSGKYNPGDVRQVYYRDLTGVTEIDVAESIPPPQKKASINRKWLCFDRDEIRETLSMYGENFLFLDRVVMEDGDIYDGFMGYARYTIPTPEQNPILKDHFVGMPLFGGHLQMEAVAQFGTFMMLKKLTDKKMVPILTGTEFPDLNTMAPPGETLTIMGVIRMPEKRNLALNAYVENRYARSKGVIRGMILNDRVVKKMMSSFGGDEDD